jgi:hypothetical protein
MGGLFTEIPPAGIVASNSKFAASISARCVAVNVYTKVWEPFVNVVLVGRPVKTGVPIVTAGTNGVMVTPVGIPVNTIAIFDPLVTV